MFIDHTKITIESGHGGHGHIGFYRARYVPNGGPNGGDGGNGGSVIFYTHTGLNTLVDFRHKRVFKAEPGENGGNNNKSGRGGKDLEIAVPVGTLIRDAKTGRIIADMSKADDRRTIAKGGRGGRGNQHFATPTRQAPKFSEDGKPGKSFEIILELKLIADAGIIGFPNAGKSTLLSMVTNAKPKIAGYQFTTLSPNLGVVRGEWGRDFVLADIPGLIEGASTGIGLGHDFLRHIERTKVLIHVVDAAGLESEKSPEEAVEAINAELAAYNPELLKRPQIIAANKMDLVNPEEQAKYMDPLCKLGKEKDWPVFAISAATNTGLKELLKAVSDTLAKYPEDVIFEPEEEDLDLPNEIEESVTVEKDEEGIYLVEGPGIERLLGYTNMNDEKGFAYFQKFMREKGIIEQLESLGIEEGDTVQMYEFEFDYYP
ncbi:MAG: GTPase ObgE [Defluviitaleaceae bacterium]|nr:GTPase ObgE [Defluviitaleaceae bacterium]